MKKEQRGKKLIVRTQAKTSRGRLIEAKMQIDSQAKNRIYITTEENRDYKATRIHLGSIDELRTFRKMIDELEQAYEEYKEQLKNQ